MSRIAQAAAISALVITAVTPVYADWPADSAALGARDHPKILQRFGGEIPDGALVEYVDEIGQLMVGYSDRSDEDWTFTLLDSPQVNAFALPGGYVYVTRGLLALAQNEAQLAAVLSHEITHVTEEHVEKRQDANSDAFIDGAVGALIGGIFGGNTMGEAIREGIEGAIGEIGQYSRAQEYAADEGGIALLIAAGYDPQAQADFLNSMAANAALKALIADRDYDPENVPFFANHPAPVERLDRARELAGSIDGAQAAAPYLAMIDGMKYGDSVRQGFVIGRQFIHPVLAFTFEAPQGLSIRNAARQVNITGPRNSTLVLSGGSAQSGSLTAYIRDWAGQIPRRDLIGRRITGLHEHDINGLPAATGYIRMRRGARRGELQMTVIRFDDRLYRFAGFSRDRDDDTQALLNQVVESFRPLTGAEADGYHDTHIEIYEVQAGDSVASLSALFPLQDYTNERFRLINGMRDSDPLIIGSLVKMIVIDSTD